MSDIRGLLLSDSWTIRVPACPEIPAMIKGHGDDVPTWWARNEMPDFRAYKQPQYLSVKIGEGSQLGTSLDGTHRYLPRCGTACDSLYKRVEDAPPRHAMFLFLDPTRIGDPKDDCFVFSEDTHRLDYDESRAVGARIANGWRPWDHGRGECQVSIALDSNWIEASDLALQLSSTALEIRPPEDHSQVRKTADCQHSIELISYELSLPEASDSNESTAATIDYEDSGFFRQNSWLFESMRRHTNPHEWHSLDVDGVDRACHRCAPPKPDLRWKLNDNANAIEPYKDSSSAATYERSIKNRPAALEIEVIQNANSRPSKIRLGANLVSMAHRTRAR